MSIETTLVKRRALYPGEVGLFPSCEMESEDLAIIAMTSSVMVTINSERRIEGLRRLWGLVWKAQQNTDYWIDKWKAMEWFKVKAGYVKPGRDPDTGEWNPLRPKSLKRISDMELRLLTERVMDLICTEVLPGMEPNELRREIEEMLRERAA
jgi:hypothetical protein